MKNKTKLEGEIDYDFDNDILFFKVKNKDYEKSIELDDFVIDMDKNGITGIQIFEASKIFNLKKPQIKSINNWGFKIESDGRIIMIKISFEFKEENRTVQRVQDLIREADFPVSKMNVQCEISA